MSVVRTAALDASAAWARKKEKKKTNTEQIQVKKMEDQFVALYQTH